MISVPYVWTYIGVRTVKFFPRAESWLVNFNFRRMKGTPVLLTAATQVMKELWKVLELDILISHWEQRETSQGDMLSRGSISAVLFWMFEWTK